MVSVSPDFPPLPWLADDGRSSLAEVLAVIGVALWVGGLVWFVVADVLHARSRTRRHRGSSSGMFHERRR